MFAARWLSDDLQVGSLDEPWRLRAVPYKRLINGLIAEARRMIRAWTPPSIAAGNIQKRLSLERRKLRVWPRRFDAHFGQRRGIPTRCLGHQPLRQCQHWGFGQWRFFAMTSNNRSRRNSARSARRPYLSAKDSIADLDAESGILCARSMASCWSSRQVAAHLAAFAASRWPSQSSPHIAAAPSPPSSAGSTYALPWGSLEPYVTVPTFSQSLTVWWEPGLPRASGQMRTRPCFFTTFAGRHRCGEPTWRSVPCRLACRPPAERRVPAHRGAFGVDEALPWDRRHQPTPSLNAGCSHTAWSQRRALLGGTRRGPRAWCPTSSVDREGVVPDLAWPPTSSGASRGARAP